MEKKSLEGRVRCNSDHGFIQGIWQSLSFTSYQETASIRPWLSELLFSSGLSSEKATTGSGCRHSAAIYSSSELEVSHKAASWDPLRFIVFLNDLAYFITGAQLNAYADDQQLYYSDHLALRT